MRILPLLLTSALVSMVSVTTLSSTADATTGATTGAMAPAAAAPMAAGLRKITYVSWSEGRWGKGTADGLRVVDGRLQIGEPAGTRGRFEYGDWRSPWLSPGFELTQVIPTWDARTPGTSRIRVQVRGRGQGSTGSWDSLGTWALTDRAMQRRSGGSQTDDNARVSYDTWKSAGVTSYQIRVRLLAQPGKASPRLVRIGSMASRLPATSNVATSRPGAQGGKALGRVLAVPSYSQMVHRGTYPQYDGGGQAWCSPTSTTMVLDYYDRLPGPRAYSWVKKDYPDRVVAHLARSVYDYRYSGAGNWAFNTAYPPVAPDRVL